MVVVVVVGQMVLVAMAVVVVVVGQMVAETIVEMVFHTFMVLYDG